MYAYMCIYMYMCIYVHIHSPSLPIDSTSIDLPAAPFFSW